MSIYRVQCEDPAIESATAQLIEEDTEARPAKARAIGKEDKVMAKWTKHCDYGDWEVRKDGEIYCSVSSEEYAAEIVAGMNAQESL